MSAASSEIVVVDYGMGNLRNVGRAFERAGARPRVTTDPDEILRSDRLVVPGVGALGDAMGALEKLGLVGPLRERIQDGRPYLGICVGLQVLLDEGEEGPARCLGLIPGKVSRFPETSELPVPHMGWNAVKPLEAHPLLEQGYFYFVHSYRPCQVPRDQVLATTDYGEVFPSAVGFDACVAVQFHPEKSQRAGLALLERFCSWSP